jgi:hypothetical protein
MGRAGLPAVPYVQNALTMAWARSQKPGRDLLVGGLGRLSAPLDRLLRLCVYQAAPLALALRLQRMCTCEMDEELVVSLLDLHRNGMQLRLDVLHVTLVQSLSVGTPVQPISSQCDTDL